MRRGPETLHTKLAGRIGVRRSNFNHPQMPVVIPANRAERIEAVERVLAARGYVVLPPVNGPTASQFKAALANFNEVVEALGLDTEWLEDGTRIAFRPHNEKDRREAIPDGPKAIISKEPTHRCEPL